MVTRRKQHKCAYNAASQVASTSHKRDIVTRGLRIAVSAALAAAVTAAAAPAARAEVEDPGDDSGLVDAARAAVESSPPQKAERAVDAALRAGHNGRRDTAMLYGMAGEIAAALGAPQRAEGYFRRMLAIDPGARPRRSYAPAVGPIFDRALTAALRAGPLAVDAHTGDNGGVVVRVTADPVSIVAGAWAEYTTADGQRREVLLPGRGGAAFLLPGRQAKTSITAGVVDEFGNRLVEVVVSRAEPGADEEPAPPPRRARTRAAAPSEEPREEARPVREPPPPARDRESAPLPVERPRAAPPQVDQRSLLLRWPLWAGLTVVAGGATGYFAWDTALAQEEAAALVADSGNHTYDELRAVEERGRRSALFANVAAGATATFALTAVVLAIWSDDDAEAPPRQASRRAARSRVSLTPPPRGSTGVGLALEF